MMDNETIEDVVDQWEQKWCSQSEGIREDAKQELIENLENLMLKKIKSHIESCMKSFVNSSGNQAIHYDRLDELFLLWSAIKEISFKQTIEYFGLVYDDFSERRYDIITSQIIKKFRDYFEELP